MFKKYSSYLLLANMLYQYSIFFSWYLGNSQIQIESAFFLGMIAFISGLVFVLFIHIAYFPRELNNSATIPTFPPLIMLFYFNIGFFVGISNLYVIQLYELPVFLDSLSSPELGVMRHYPRSLVHCFVEDKRPEQNKDEELLFRGELFSITPESEQLCWVRDCTSDHEIPETQSKISGWMKWLNQA